MVISPDLKQIAKDAIAVQDACNLMGVSRLLVKATDVLFNELKHGRLSGTNDINKHPVVQMIVNKLSSLSNAEYGFSDAYDACKKLAESPTTDDEPADNRTDEPAVSCIGD